MLERLRARGLDLSFSRLRLSWFEGIVAEQVRFGRSGNPPGRNSPRPKCRSAQCQGSCRRQVKIDSLILHDGKLSWPMLESNGAPRQLALDHLETELRLLPQDQWALDNFRAVFQGVRIRLGGVLTNASAIRDLKLFQGQARSPGPAKIWEQRMRRFADTLERIQFTSSPELNLRISGDAKDLQTFGVHLTVAAPGAQTPWGAVSDGRAEIRLKPADSNDISQVELELTATGAQTQWGAASNLNLAVTLRQADSFTNTVRGLLRLSAELATSEWATTSNFVFTANWVHALTNPVPLSGHGQIECENAQTRWAGSRHVRVTGDLATPLLRNGPSMADPSWMWWTNIAPYNLNLECELTDNRSPHLDVESVRCQAIWSAPELSLSNLQAVIDQRKLGAAATLNVASRQLHAQLTSTIDPHKIAPVLTDGARKWLQQFTWAAPPDVQGQVELTLPAWTNREPDWGAEVQPSLSLAGEFTVQHGGSYRGVQADAAHSHFSYSNMCWHLPDLAVARAPGRLEAEHREDDRTKEFYWHIKSSVDPNIARPLLGPDPQRVFDLIGLTSPPVVEAEVWGRSHSPEQTGVRGRIALTNFSFRGESATTLQAELLYTNKLLTVIAPRLERGTQHVSADGLLADFNAEVIYLTNGFSTADPLFVARAIGPKIAKTIAPYQFERPPTARVHGIIPLHGEEAANLHFDIEGGPFHWWKFNLPYIAGHVHWAGLQLDISELRTRFYDGVASGAAGFRFPEDRDMDFHFTATVTNALLQSLMADLSAHTNRLEGRLDGTVVVTHALGSRSDSVQGYGLLRLRDGLIWDIPIFGVFSPVLDGIVPGLGTSRASAAACTFAMTNGVVRSDDLEIRSPALRVQYRGTVDLDSKVNARVEAELLRDMWLVGPLVSTVFWPVTKMFEYRVTGTLSEPQTDPVYIIPKLVLLPFQPFRWLRGVLPDESPRTNAPPHKPADR